ncbi:hypothetical protein JNUCC31_25175 [Paenibacillus sp. JNUCC31]|uniref:hypothetical protein n=1 Tax=Paenibacillus sp. JNUCC-31 TaxID=2777983 RepID=UPI00177BDB3D|nr:hypothetical protein [Paenibacillus sp. JNUCC-31]QOS77957.1 hypothetical protein JNUCC31_24935 [Paenibacillus sp. JNUCC-31]QOS78001.1 hypothetical protein JNUCC31_25175 [Paenibacillus sp. JNUCC-31]
MKAVPKVNTDGLYMEDELVDDAFSGVVPFYVEPEPVVFNPDAPEQPAEPDVQEEDEEEVEREIAGYIVGVPVPAGLFRPRFDIAAWEAYQDAIKDGPQEKFPDLWVEGLSQAEIDELTKPRPAEPSETDMLGQQLSIMKLQAMQQSSTVNALGQELAISKLNSMQQQQMIGNLGAELAATKLELINLKGADLV